MNDPLFVSAGEALIDFIADDAGRYVPHLGGSIFNFALALARQGVSSAYANPLSDDVFGKQFRQRLESAGVRLLSPQAVRAPTSLALITVDANGVPHYSFHRSDVADRAFDVHELIQSLASAAALHLGCFAFMPEDADRYRQLAHDVHQRGGLITMDANMRPVVARDPALYAASVMQSLPMAHVIKVSDEDLQHLSLASPTSSDEDMIATVRHHWLNHSSTHPSHTQVVALTLGARGAYVLTATSQWFAAPPSGLKIVDTVGAGDCFFASLISSLWKDGVWQSAQWHATSEQLAQSLGRGIAGASVNIQRAGCQPGTWDEISDLAQRVIVKAMPSG